MKKFTDEKLNDYLDNNLTNKEIEEINYALSNDSNLLERLKALKSVDKYLNTLQHQKAPEGIKKNVMIKIASLIPQKQKNTFFRIILSIFGISIISVITFSLTLISKMENNSSLWEKVKSLLSEYFPSDLSFLETLSFSNNTILIGASITILLLFIFYYLINAHKSFKNELKNFGQ
jgi:hypothetical protein